jgi:hypothetical protein
MANWRYDQSCTGHRRTVLETDLCGCFYCLSMFPPSAIEELMEEDAHGVGQTALCPGCGIDAVLPSVPGRPITYELLRRLSEDQFGSPNDKRLPK